MKRRGASGEVERQVRPCHAPADHKRKAEQVDGERRVRACPTAARHEQALAVREQALAVREQALTVREQALTDAARMLEAWQAQLQQRECNGPRFLQQGLPYCL